MNSEKLKGSEVVMIRWNHWLFCGIFAFAFFLVGCSSRSPSNEALLLPSPAVDLKILAYKGATQIRKGHYAKARVYLSQGLRYSPTNCKLNFLNALSYQLEGRGGNLNELKIAQAGYQIAIRFCPRDPWPYYFNGLIQMQEGEYAGAEDSFKMATQVGSQSDLPKFMQHYLEAAYRAGDAKGIADIAAKLSQHYFATGAISQAQQAQLKTDIQAITNRMAKMPQPFYKPIYRVKKPLKKQVIVDAVIILNREVVTERRGVNLLTGLQLQYGSSTAPGFSGIYSRFGTQNWYAYGKTTQGVIPSSGGFPDAPFSRLVTNVVSIPAVTYDLNIFNNIDEQDEILSRPTLVAEDGETATYFSGRNLIVGIQGTQTGTIQTFPIGLHMDLTPVFMKDGSINLNITIGRDLLVPATENTTFQQTAETLSQKTHTTVNVHYGETVILSALTEAIKEQNSNRTPGLGNLPILKYFFNRKDKTDEQTSVLFLLTPQRYLSFASPISQAEERKMQEYYVNSIDPSTNLVRLLRDLKLMHLYHTSPLLATAFYDSSTIESAVSEEIEGAGL